jgi:hypothetical protein
MAKTSILAILLCLAAGCRPGPKAAPPPDPVQAWLDALPPHLRARYPETLDLSAFEEALDGFEKEAKAKGYLLHACCWKAESLPGLEKEASPELRALPDRIRRVFFNPHVLWSHERAERWDALVGVEGRGIVIVKDALNGSLDLTGPYQGKESLKPVCEEGDAQFEWLERGDPRDPAGGYRHDLTAMLTRIEEMQRRPLRALHWNYHDGGMSIYHPVLGLAGHVISLEGGYDNRTIPALTPTHGGGALLWKKHWMDSVILDRRDGWVFFRCKGELLAADEALLATWPRIKGSRLD